MESKMSCLLQVPQTRDQTPNSGMYPDRESSLQPFSEGDNAPNEPPGQGSPISFKIDFIVVMIVVLKCQTTYFSIWQVYLIKVD